ncbi:GGDEF domain-containing protein [Thalassolituus sp. ST750PaO-4]|uniref:GGDEF domain-containing protein n=1 Tax=Thalassolituus sp. ST750PaO-4 TaxID=2742965 RepID=UPI001CE289AD|nr:GGDEF domain-containing protein [Thalassolituus sp. ST750PaO-4]MCA6060265.1 GGDEF domain-containing protein [Thalassolituus sp. ST750PaO-4]
MLADLSQDELLPRLQAVVYLLASVAIGILMYDQYRQGLYPLVLSNAIAIPAFVFSAIFIYINRDRDSFSWVNYPLIFTLAGLALYQLPQYPQLMTHYLYALPLFSYFCLPLYPATVFNVVVAVLMTLLLWLDHGFMLALRTGTNYSLLLGSAWCFAYLTLLKGWSLKRLALTDQTSGAYNRRHFFHALTREIARSESTRHSVSLIGLVIDDYRQLIDIHGNRVMSQFLPRFVERTQRQIRAGDEIFRLADDLFVLALPNCPEDGAIVLMERVKRTLQQQAWKPFAEISISASAVGLQSGEDSKDLEKRLSAKLKKQKRASLQLAAFAD